VSTRVALIAGSNAKPTPVSADTVTVNASTLGVMAYMVGTFPAEGIERPVTLEQRIVRVRLRPGMVGKVIQLVRVLDWERSEEHGVDESEEGGIRADAESEREDGRSCHHRGLPHRARGETQVQAKVVTYRT
jgi:hypothetical protein